MSDWLMRVIKAEAKRLIELAADDDELRADLRALAESILAATAPSASVIESMEQSPALSEGNQTDAPEADEPLRELTLGRSPPPKSDLRSAAPATSSQRDALADDLVRLETRCRQKAEAAYWAAERLRRAREGNDCAVEDAPIDPEMAAWGSGLVDSFFWLQATNNVAVC